jgi:putative phosphoesterase
MKASRLNPSETFEDDGYCLLGADTLLTRTQELEDQVHGVRESNEIEHVHALRVESRRTRTALTLFEPCFGKKLAKKWDKTIRNVTRSSGAARDADVQIAFLESYARTNEDKNTEQVLDYLIKSHTARRRAMQASMMKALDDLDASKILSDIANSCGALRARERKESNIRTLATYGKAYDHISSRLSKVLALEPFVHDEGASEKHHELRIAFKRLRYTMEIFSILYKRGLIDQISLMKRFQDLLGEMHDCDVWTQEFNVEMESMPADARYGVSRVLTHLSEKRRSGYMNLVSLWNDAISTGQFATIGQLTNPRPSSMIIREMLNRDNVKVALISDIHGNLDALNAVLADAKRSGLTIFLNAGDAVGFGIYPSQVIKIVRSARFLSTVGNVDLETLEALRNPKNDALSFAIKELSPSDTAYLESLPRELHLEIADKRVLVTHGTPDSVDEHIYPDSPEERLREIAAKASADVIITGHSHTQMKRVIEGVAFINPGSVGRPVDGDPKAEYAVLSFKPLTVEFRRVSYDVEALADKMRMNGLPEDHVQVLLQGVPLKIIRKQEEVLEKKQLWKRKSTIDKVRVAARTFNFNESHAEQDRKLALMIFDQTKQLYSLGGKERYWLECAAILHDIGLSRGTQGHHKSTLRLILNDSQLPFTYHERYMIGGIARYHRKAIPNKKHFNLKPFNHIEREKIALLSSILRVADALDYSHKSVVQRVDVKLSPNHIILEITALGEHSLEEKSVMKKKDLFEKVFKDELTLVWRSQPTT